MFIPWSEIFYAGLGQHQQKDRTVRTGQGIVGGLLRNQGGLRQAALQGLALR